jgi:hypothetical protein
MTPLSDDDRRTILALLDEEIAATPAPRNLSPVGCLVFVVAVLVFYALSILTRRWGLPELVRTVIFVVNVLALVGGVALIFFGGGSGESRARAAATEALERLTVQRELKAAVRLLANAYYSGGPWMITTIDVEGARERLERAGVLGWLREIEEFLVSEKRVNPVFTVGVTGG